MKLQVCSPTTMSLTFATSHQVTLKSSAVSTDKNRNGV